ncbi:hypothetical protein ABZW18_10520 [Streptomyces sp. NPDC004647]|uniref:hypothetical protein n=1 Tax=Streptomyces sp. NPDC004647 TaxID=3154671 RepID=UPI0033BBE311
MRFSRRTTSAPAHIRDTPDSTAGGPLARTIGASLSVALLALPGLALGNTAMAAEHRAAAPAGDYCAPKTQLYSEDRWTYAEAQVCLRFGPGGNEVRVNNSQPQYYWGSAWYNASSRYPASWSASGTVTKSGESENYATPSPVTQGSAEGSASGGSPAVLNGCGTYSVTMTFHQAGPYWNEIPIDSGELTYDINVPCT